ncbi:hypothetical protein [Psychroserpens sp. Hel_I_66]|uniref:hypothetical protein n=1 Tax=Psychroserpens sp. Hel_I_66 TaxID=1250004 RepID=UPI00064572C7|nr:hypothetical protein [Psychroserpens sp. Hel_I_66]
MNKDFSKCRNVITLDKGYNLNEDQLIQLIENNIFLKGHEFPKEDYNVFVKPNENFHIEGTEVLYNFFDYQLNPKIVNHILNDLQDILQKYFKYRYELPKEEIKFELGQYLTHEDKLNYLNEKHNEIWNFSEYLKTPNSKSEFLRFYEMDQEEFFKSEDWLIWIWENSENHHILRYLSTNDRVYDCFKVFMDKWIEYGKIKALSLYLKELLIIQDASALNKGTTGYRNLTPLEQFSFIDILREKDVNFEILDIDIQFKYLKVFNSKIGGSDYVSLERLKNLVGLPLDDFENLTASEYARELKKISNSSLSNLRKAFRKHDIASIKADKPEDLKPNELDHNKKVYVQQEKIKKARNFVIDRMINLGI